MSTAFGAVLFIAIATAWGVGTAAIADYKKNRTRWWGLLGVVLGLIGLIIVACLPKVEEKLDDIGWQYER